jgi:CheY-like chemotaxis protein
MFIRDIVKNASRSFLTRRKTTILVSDYDSINRQSLGELLRDQDYAVLEAAHSGTAVQIADRERPDLILLCNDTLLLSGKTAVAIIRSNARTRDIPIIVISPNNKLSDVEECLSQGASDYLVKPVDPFYLLAKVQKLVGAKAV